MYEPLRPYEHYIPFAALVMGFIWDSITLARPDRLFDNIVLISHLSIAAGAIVLLNVRQRNISIGPVPLTGLMQFSFGSLTSGILVLYFKSGTMATGALFFGFLFALLIGNEFLHSRYALAYFHITVWYILLLSYLGLVVPVLFGTIGPTIFLFSGVLSLGIVALLLISLYHSAAQAIKKGLVRIVTSVLTVFAIFNGLYFLNLIPPVPLALKHIGVYHALTRTNDGNYLLAYEPKRWWEYFDDTSAVFHRTTGESVFCFSSVFAPDRISTPIYHRWERWDPVAEEWNTELRILFDINGGRDEGFRGYTEKIKLTDGRWRCSVETNNGALIGRTTFDIIPTEEPIATIEREL